MSGRFQKTLANQIKECLTSGWSSHERYHWKDYLEEEIKPYWFELYVFLRVHCDRS